MLICMTGANLSFMGNFLFTLVLLLILLFIKYASYILAFITLYRARF